MIITSAPCMPLGTYHIGNAISAICTDVIANLYRYIIDGHNNIVSVSTPWNLHGRPYETMYTNMFNREAEYDGVLSVANDSLNKAIKETSLFIKPECSVEHNDTQKDFVEFSTECFIILIEKKIIVKHKGYYCLDIDKIVTDYDCVAAFNRIDYFPLYIGKTIMKQGNTFCDYYPMVKQRCFTVCFDYCGEKISVNPIFQSLIYPIYLIKKYKSSTVDYFVSSSGFSMNKWHYLRQLVSLALIEKESVSTIYTHGVILGEDGKPMSKHSKNTICPSDLVNGIDDYFYLRYVLIRSISIYNIHIDLVKCNKEYCSIKQKILLLNSGLHVYPVSTDEMELIYQVERFLFMKKFSVALETFYLFLRKTSFSENGNIKDYIRIRNVFCVFFGQIRGDGKFVDGQLKSDCNYQII